MVSRFFWRPPARPFRRPSVDGNQKKAFLAPHVHSRGRTTDAISEHNTSDIALDAHFPQVYLVHARFIHKHTATRSNLRPVNIRCYNYADTSARSSSRTARENRHCILTQHGTPSCAYLVKWAHVLMLFVAYRVVNWPHKHNKTELLLLHFQT